MNRQGWSCDLARSAIKASIQRSQSHTPGQDEGASRTHHTVCSRSQQEDLRGVSVAYIQGAECVFFFLRKLVEIPYDSVFSPVE